MSAASASVRTNVQTVRRMVPDPVWMLIFLGIALIWPSIIDQLFDDPQPFLDANIEALAYIIMALGLNIVVGFAGLLDLGYVAFYAIGAFVAGWLASAQFPNIAGGDGLHILASDAAEKLPGIHINFLLIIFIAAAFTAIWARSWARRRCASG